MEKDIETSENTCSGTNGFPFAAAAGVYFEMPVILLGSYLNPLSAVTANFFFRSGELKAVILPAKLPTIRHGGIIYCLSQIIVALVRYVHIILRCLAIKKGESFLSLKEFLKIHRDIPTMKVDPSSFNLDLIVRGFIKEDEIEKTWIISCIFPYKIQVDRIKGARLINIHPGLLPENRGPNPYFWCLAKRFNESGITFHILTGKIDHGPILYKVKFSITNSISEHRLEAMSAKILNAALPFFWGNIDQLWVQRQSQHNGEYFPEPTIKDRKKYGRLSVLSHN